MKKSSGLKGLVWDTNVAGIKLRYTAGDESGNQWLNGATISFIYLILLLLSVNVGCVRQYLNMCTLSFII